MPRFNICIDEKQVAILREALEALFVRVPATVAAQTSERTESIVDMGAMLRSLVPGDDQLNDFTL